MKQGEPFSLTVSVNDLPPTGRHLTIEADAASREQIARRLEIPAVEHLAGAFDVTPREGGLTVKGELKAHLTRQCVASLESVEETVAEPFEIRFSREAAQEGGEIAVDPETEAPEPLESDVLDLAEILIQQLALAMTLYPRKEGAPPLAEAYGEERAISPFEALRDAFTGKRDKG